MIDFDHYILPDVITLPGIVLGLALQPWILVVLHRLHLDPSQKNKTASVSWVGLLSGCLWLTAHPQA